MPSFAMHYVAALLLPFSSSQVEAARQPTERWVVNFADSQCIASRNYGTDKNPLLLVLKATPLGDMMQLVIMRQGIGGDPIQAGATLTIDNQPRLPISILDYQPKKAGLRIYRMNLPAIEFEPLSRAKSIAIWSPGLSERFALSNMAPLLKTMDKCLAGLRSVWNITDSSGDQSKLRVRAKATLAKFFNNRDYPAVAIDKNQSGIVTFALLVDQTGKVADCTIIETSGAAALDAQSCNVLEQRATFTPAVGIDGKPAKDAVIARVRWVIRR